MTYVKKTEAKKLFRSKGHIVFSSHSSASKYIARKKIGAAIMGIGGGNYIIKRDKRLERR